MFPEYRQPPGQFKAGMKLEADTDYSKVDKLLFTLLSKAINVSTTELNSIYESTIKHFTKKAR